MKRKMAGSRRIRLVARRRQRFSMKQVAWVSSSLVVVLTFGLVAFFNFSDSKESYGAVNNDYRTVASGDWNTLSIWQTYNGTSWVAASSAPASAKNVIQIQNGHSVTTTTNISADQVTVDAGGVLVVSSATLTIANGTGTDLTVNGTLQINGTLSIGSSGAVDVNSLATLKSSGSISFGSSSMVNVNGRFKREGGSMATSASNWSINDGGTFQHAMNGGNLLPTGSWKTGSTCEVTGITTTMPGNINSIFYNLTWNCTGQLSGFDFNARLDFVNGDLNLISTGASTLQLDYQGNNNTLNIGGNLNIQGGISYGCANGSAIINIAGDYVQTGGTFNFNKSFATAYGNTSTTLNISGDLNISGGTLDMTQSTANNPSIGIGHIFLDGNLSVSGTGKLTETSLLSRGQFYFDGTGIQTYQLNNLLLSTIDFIISAGATVRAGTEVLTGAGNFTLMPGAHLMIGSPVGITQITPLGNIQVLGTRTFDTGADYTYEGTSVQLTGNGLPSTVRNLTFNNSSGVTLTGSVSASGQLALTSGIVSTLLFELGVTNTAEASVTGYSASSYVAGKLRRTVSATGTYHFPVGSSSQYELASLSLSGVTGFTSILGTFTNALPVTVSLPLLNLSVLGINISEMLNYGYWTFSPNSPQTGGTYSIALNESGATNSVANPQSYCVLKRANALSAWASVGTHNSATQSILNGTVTAVRSGLSGFSDFGIGGSGGATLPIKLVYFRAVLNEGAVYLEWETSAEINNNYFTIERSGDGEHFESLLTKPGAGNSTVNLFYNATDSSPLDGFSYYRLKQTDYDGRYSYSDVETVKNGEGNEPESAALEIKSVAPNPFMEEFKVSFMIKKEALVDFMLFSSAGQLIAQDRIEGEAGFNTYNFKDTYNLKKGIYFINLITGDHKVVHKIIRN